MLNSSLLWVVHIMPYLQQLQNSANCKQFPFHHDFRGKVVTSKHIELCSRADEEIICVRGEKNKANRIY